MEADVFKFQVTIDCRSESKSDSRFWLMVHHGAEHPNRQRTLLIGMNQSNQLNQRPGNPTGDHLKRYQFTDGQVFPKYQRGSKKDDNHGQEFLQQLGNRCRGD